MRVDRFPEPGTKVQASEFLITSGGQSGNAAVAISRLGSHVSFVGPLGAEDDEFASRIVRTLMHLSTSWRASRSPVTIVVW